MRTQKHKPDHKLSYYVIFSEPLNSEKKRVLFSSRTGKSLVITNICYECLSNGFFNEIPEMIFDRLKSIKAIVPSDENELQSIVDENLENEEAKEVLYEVIQPSAMCQLGCYYCGQNHVKQNVSADLIQSIIKRIEGKIKSRKYKELHIGWFGGEPLMGLPQMRELSIQLKVLTEKYGLTYSSKIVTNGLSLKKEIFYELVNDLKVKSIEVTLDGTSEFHDKHRYTKKGKPSFDLIFKNLLEIFNLPDYSELDCSISIRCNVDYDNVNGVSPLIELMEKNNIHKKVSYFYPIGIYSWAGNDAHKNSLSKEDFARKELNWLLEMIEKDFPINIPIPARKKSLCIATSSDSDLYDAYGNIFSCTEVSLASDSEESEFISGHLLKGENDEGTRPLQNWNRDLLTDEFPCHSCKMLPVCGGSCPKSWMEGMPACPTSKFNIKEKLKLAYETQKSNSYNSEELKRYVAEISELQPV